MNLSARTLTSSDLSVLTKGLSFCPLAHLNAFQFEVELFKFSRTLKLKQFFGNRTTDLTPSPSSDTNEASKFRLRSRFTPPGHYGSIDSYINMLRHDVHTNPSSPRIHNNLNKAERSALKSLSEDVSIIIKPADKGGALVVMNYADYSMGIHDMLSDATSYKKIPGNPFHRTLDHVKILARLGCTNGWIDENTSEFLINEHYITPVIYGLPKIHKGLQPLKYRPIVSGTKSVTQPLAQFIDFHLQPIVRTLPAYLRDTGDFLDKVASFTTFPEESLLATMDISSLYTCIPDAAGIKAVRHFLCKHGPSGIPHEYLLDCLNCVLTNNFFKFEGTTYQQIHGTAMGSAAAPAFANLFVGYLEELFIYTSDLYKNHVRLWLRYIDDIFVIWHGGIDMFNEFVHYLNSIFTGIVFNPEISAFSIAFLDVLVSVNQGSIVTSLYSKPTDRNTLLHYDSAHPKHLLNSLPISQFDRVMKICSDPEDRDIHLDKMYTKFLDRGYPPRVLDSALQRSLCPAHMRKSKIAPDKVPFIHSFNQLSPFIAKSTKNHIGILQADRATPHMLKNPPLLIYKRCRSLRDHLVQADPRTKYQKAPFPLSAREGCYRCGRCNICNAIIPGKFFTHPHQGHNIQIRGYFNCETEYCVYLLKCPCSLVYVGMTTGPFKRRFQKHRSDIRIAIDKIHKNESPDPNKPVAIHFATKGHQTHDLRATVIDHIKKPPRGGNRASLLFQREAFWIFTLATVSPKGLNTDASLTCFLEPR